MTRDLDRLASTTFDLLVIGAGIYGATAAWDATQRGLSVAIIDQADFGAGTSFNSAKTVHGGVRMLQSGRIGELRAFVRERRALSRIVPHLVQPLPFVIPTYRSVARHRRLLQAYFTAYDLLGWDRNAGLDPSHRLPSSRLLSRQEYLRLSPLVDPQGVTGGIEWHDCQMYNSDRVTLAFLQTASAQGACPANYVSAGRLGRRQGDVTTVAARDELTGCDLEIASRTVLNCGGPWAPSLLRTLATDVAPAVPDGLSVAMNLVIGRRLLTTHATGGPAHGRLLFMAPWRDRTIVGTSHDPFTGSPQTFRPTESLVHQLVDDANAAFPGAGLRPDDITLLHRGLLPAVGRGASCPPVTLLKSSQILDHAADGLPGVISVLGVRYTTARGTGQRAVDTVFRRLGRTPPPCRTAVTPLHGGDIDDLGTFLTRAPDDLSPLPASAAVRVARSYGRTGEAIRNQARDHPGDARPLGAHCDVTRAEIRHAVTAEAAVTLADAVLRRTEAGSGGHPGEDALASAAEVLAQELGWRPSRVADEIEDVRRVYRWTDDDRSPLKPGAYQHTPAASAPGPSD